MKKWLILILASCLSFPVVAQDMDLESQPGFVDLGELGEVYGEPRVMININGFLLKFMAMAASHDDPQAAAVLKDLQGIRVNVYETDGVLSPAKEQIAAVKGVLQKLNWQPVVQVKEEGEEVQIFMKGDDSGMQGLTVMTVNEEEAVFINIIGEIDPSQLDMVMKNIDLDMGGDDEDEDDGRAK
jgi:hypothetical protein